MILSTTNLWICIYLRSLKTHQVEFMIDIDIQRLKNPEF